MCSHDKNSPFRTIIVVVHQQKGTNISASHMNAPKNRKPAKEVPIGKINLFLKHKSIGVPQKYKGNLHGLHLVVNGESHQ